MPPSPLRPVAARHRLARVRPNSLRGRVNSVIESRVDVRADIDAINRGEAVRDGNTFTVNGRVYGMEPNGAAYPITGSGVHQLNRPAYKALGWYNLLGDTDEAERQLDREQIDAEHRAAALKAWRAERER